MTTQTMNEDKSTAAIQDDAAREVGGKYLTFKLGHEQYGVAILKVRELIGLMEITAVPQMPLSMKGVINLRGKVIPVIDLRLKFGMEPAPYTEQTCIIVINVGKEIGIIVDAVSEVLDIAAKDIEPPPSLSAATDTSCILGMGKVGTAVKILLDIERALAIDETTDLAALAGVQPVAEPVA